jgi:hypothetical protein
MSFTQRLPRILLWLLLFVFPALYCVLFVISDFVSVFLFFYPSPEMTDGPVGGSQSLWSYNLRLVTLAAIWLHPLWIAFISCAPLLLSGAFVIRFIKRKPLIVAPSSAMQLASQLLGLLFLAYVLGSVLHFASSSWLSESPYTTSSQSNYWWPYYGWPVQDSVVQGWTIYPPLSVDLHMSPWAQAACFKLGALLALLVARYIWLRRNGTLLQHS